MRVAITGGCGFIGSNLTLYLQRTEPDTEIVLVDIAAPCVPMGPKTRYVYADIRNLASLLDAFKGCDEVYNLAGVLGTSELLSIPSLSVETNVAGAANVLDAARHMGVKRVYNVAKPHFEGYAENAYTLTKHAGELLGIMYRDKFNMEVATVRWLNAVGPHQHLFPVRKFLPMMILLALYDFPLEIYGSGNQTIDPIDVEDLSRFTVHACRHLGKHPTVVDLGSGSDISCNDACALILQEVQWALQETVGTQSLSQVVHIPMREGEADDIMLKADMAYWTSVGMKAEVPFVQSIANTVRYILGLPEEHRQNALAFYGKAAPTLKDLNRRKMAHKTVTLC
jgi:nucleoside-diphosphate-sugar epimerase